MEAKWFTDLSRSSRRGHKQEWPQTKNFKGSVWDFFLVLIVLRLDFQAIPWNHTYRFKAALDP
ncbi:hypothetical protein Leryth_007095 [Lithospermum erythrorhizon]|nr:hypothetical protein Leryth_007095 [Lithospermum erythrorhizon]